MLIVTQSYAFAEVVMLPKFTAYPAQTLQQILGLSLDVLIFTEVGMVHDIFFLAHSRLAKRTLSFWGHAITSGIVDFAYLMGRAAAAEKEEEGEEEEEGAGSCPIIEEVRITSSLLYYLKHVWMVKQTLGIPGATTPAGAAVAAAMSAMR